MITAKKQDEKTDRAAEIVRSRYNRVARIYDLEQAFGERLIFGRLRRDLWESAPSSGSILEVGVGTGASVPLYPHGAHITAIDISDRMLAKAKARADRAQIRVDLRLMDAQNMGFADGTFDAVLATCVFCSVPDPIAGLREVLRVLKPGGQALLLEHVRSGNSVMGKMMDLMNPIAVRMSGANINRRTVENVRAAGFTIIDVESNMLGMIKTIRGTKAA